MGRGGGRPSAVDFNPPATPKRFLETRSLTPAEPDSAVLKTAFDPNADIEQRLMLQERTRVLPYQSTRLSCYDAVS